MKKDGRINAGIKVKLLGILVPVVILVIAVIVIIVNINTKGILIKSSEDYLKVSTQGIMNEVETWMKETITALEIERDTIEYMDMDYDEQLEYVTHTAGVYDAFPAGIYTAISENGSLIHSSFVPGPEYDINQKPWYNDGLVSEKFIFGSVYFDEDSQSYVVGASGMLKNGDGEVIGVAAADIYLNAISEIVKDVVLEKTGAIFLVDGNTETIIGHKDSEAVGKVLTEQDDPLYTYAESCISSGKTGLDKITGANGERIYVDVEVVPDSNWYTIAYVPEIEILDQLQGLTMKIVLVSVVGCIILIVLMERIIHLVIKPVKQVSRVVEEMAQGDFTVNIDVNTSDEIGVMAEKVKKFTNRMRETITQVTGVSHTLKEQAENSSSISTDLSGASDSMQEMSKGLQQLIDSIARVASQAESLSQKVEESSEKGRAADEEMVEAVTASEQGMSDMKRINTFMEQITEKMNMLEESATEMDGAIDKINNMVEMIRNISEETNLLSLNASIEAARAGEAGRGFAVVAGQIGSLAQTSKNAVDDIALLTEEIGNMVRKTAEESHNSASVVKNSGKIIDETGATFGKIYESVTRTNDAVVSMVGNIDEVNSIAGAMVETTQHQMEVSKEILSASEEMKEEAQKVSDHGKELSKDVKGLKTNAELLDSLMSAFKI